MQEGNSRDELIALGKKDVVNYLAHQQSSLGLNCGRDIAIGALDAVAAHIERTHGLRASYELLRLQLDVIEGRMAEQALAEQNTRGRR